MLITKAAIEERLAGLTAHRDQLIQQINMQNGAIADCEHWLQVYDEPEPATVVDEEATS